eukprot:6898837-Prymnesium_polylepis.1
MPPAGWTRAGRPTARGTAAARGASRRAAQEAAQRAARSSGERGAASEKQPAANSACAHIRTHGALVTCALSMAVASCSFCRPAGKRQSISSMKRIDGASLCARAK